MLLRVQHLLVIGIRVQVYSKLRIWIYFMREALSRVYDSLRASERHDDDDRSAKPITLPLTVGAPRNKSVYCSRPYLNRYRRREWVAKQAKRRQPELWQLEPGPTSDPRLHLPPPRRRRPCPRLPPRHHLLPTSHRPHRVL